MTIETNPGDPEVEVKDQDEEIDGVDLDTEEAEEGDEEAAQSKAEEENEEVEHEGKKYKIPKPLKGALLMQADYTRKTQEVAEQRRQIEQAREAFEARQKLQESVTTENARVVALNDAIAQYEKVDWNTLAQTNRQAYDEHWRNYQQTLIAKNRATDELNKKIGEVSSKANAEAQTQFEKFRTEALAAVPEISNPDYVGKLNAYAVSLGFTPQELSAVRDVRILKALNAAYTGTLAKTTQAAQAKAKAAETAKPLPTVRGTAGNRVSPSDPSSDRLSADEWMKRRNQQSGAPLTLRKNTGR